MPNNRRLKKLSQGSTSKSV